MYIGLEAYQYSKLQQGVELEGGVRKTKFVLLVEKGYREDNDGNWRLQRQVHCIVLTREPRATSNVLCKVKLVDKVS